MIFFIVLAVLVGGPFLIIGFFMLLSWRAKRALHNATATRDARGRSIPLTRLGRTHSVNLPIGLSLLSQAGIDQSPEYSLNRITLRPTIGVRLVGFIGTAMLLSIIVISPGEFIPHHPVVYLVGGALLLYAILFTNLYRLTYDAEGFTAPNFSFQPTQMLWKDLARIEDNGHYLYVLRTRAGPRIEVQKYLVGIDDFLAYAQDQIAYHDKMAGQMPPPGGLQMSPRFTM